MFIRSIALASYLQGVSICIFSLFCCSLLACPPPVAPLIANPFYVSSILTHLNTYKSFGSDGLHAHLLRLLSSFIAAPSDEYFNNRQTNRVLVLLKVLVGDIHDSIAGHFHCHHLLRKYLRRLYMLDLARKTSTKWKSSPNTEMMIK